MTCLPTWPVSQLGLSPNEFNPDNAVRNLVAFLPVLAFDGANMTQIDAGANLDIAMAGTSVVRLKVFNTEQMNAAVFAFRRYEDASLRYTGLLSHDGLTHDGSYDTVVAKD